MKQQTNSAQPVTKKDLQDFGKQLITEIRREFRQEMDDREKSIVGTLRQEMDDREKSMKAYIKTELDTREVSLKAHTEDVVGHHSREILQAIAEVVEPMDQRVKKHDRLLGRLKKAVT